MTREQEIQERLNAVGCDNAVDGDGFKDVGFLEPDASFYGEAFGDITYLLARVKELEQPALVDLSGIALAVSVIKDRIGDHSFAVPTRLMLDQLLADLTAAQATNAQRDARLFKAGVEAATVVVEHWTNQRERVFDALVKRLRALATDDAAIQAAVDQT